MKNLRSRSSSQSRKASTGQHYVPRLLLRGFARSKNQQLYVFDKHEDKIFMSSIKNLACEHGFYEVHGSENPNWLDDWLTKLEGHTAPIIESIRTRRRLDHLQLSERQWIATFVAIQHTRTRHRMETWSHLNKEITDSLRDRGVEPGDIKNFGPMSESEIRQSALRNLPDAASVLIPHVLDKAWILLSAEAQARFWIGDHPVVLANNANPGDGFRGTLGFAVLGIEIYMPISTELTLGFLCPTIRGNFAAMKAGFIKPSGPLGRIDEFIEGFLGRSTLALNSDHMKYQNSMQLIGSERFVFSSEGDFSMAREIIATNPRSKTGPRIESAGRTKR